MNFIDAVSKKLTHTEEDHDFGTLGQKISGKVRDCYVIGDKRVLISSDRLSAFDVILTTIPYKGQILNELTAYWFEVTSDIISNHIINRPHPSVFVAREASIIPIEVVVRGYLAGGGWREYEASGVVSGIRLPEGLQKYQKLPEPILTPSTKAEQGDHDVPISEEEILEKGICEEGLWREIKDKALALYKRGAELVSERNLILVDTKYEFGLVKDSNGDSQLILADEIHTQDSSRYWMADSYKERFSQGKDPEMMDKEYVRRWLIEKGYMGDGTPPEIPDAFRMEIAERYVSALRQITGKEFLPDDTPLTEEIIKAAL